MDQKIVLWRVLKFKRAGISWPIRFVLYLFVLEPKNFLLISFWAGFSRMFLFCVFKNVTLILIRFSSEIS